VLDSSLVSINGISFEGATISIFPNPVNESATFLVDGWDFSSGSLHLEILDMYGRTLKETLLQDPHSKIGRSELAAGMYFYKISDGAKIVGAGKLMFK